ncbi:CvpA family protein [Tardiphaga sp. 37S4]|jgi:membrane protein required for colicin V production|uniref:CvpA family protein n=1 Tax=unclassified Tardiphaga TaxID=2631404 RepID=UPI000B65C725|nr:MULTISPECIES: CvpA family protein [unclassified Tardiphaga]UFS75856.1 CvpA family protein [Tardiphaga sp. 37S4]SNT48995.1 membrane protein required for colicin V production [Tardiphaga sp. OK246]
MNSFDVVVYVGLIVAMVIGFRAGLLRSAVTILGYLLAMPIAVWITGLIAPQLSGSAAASTTQNSLLFFAIFLVSGIVLGSLLRMAINDVIGHEIGIGDRLGGALLGAIRVGLIAVTLVLIFDQLVPADRQPAYMTGSQLRPLLSLAGQKGVKSLPPDVTATIEQWKRAHRL